MDQGVAAGLNEPGEARLPDPGGSLVVDATHAVGPMARRVRLTSGAALSFQAIIGATGSTPRLLDPELPGVADTVAVDRLSALHSVSDALVTKSPWWLGR